MPGKALAARGGATMRWFLWLYVAGVDVAVFSAMYLIFRSMRPK